MDNCTKFIFKNVNHTHTHYRHYSHDIEMKIIMGWGGFLWGGHCGICYMDNLEKN